MPAAAITKPWWVCTIVVGPRRATTRAVSAASTASRAASRSGPSAGTSTSRPSAFDTILLVTTSTSPSRSHGAAVVISAARSSPAVTSPMPRTGRTLQAVHQATPASSSAEATIVAVASSSVIHNGTARVVMPGTSAPASVVSTSQPSSRPISARDAVQCGHPGRAHLDAQRGQAPVGHAAHRAIRR